MTQNPFQDIPGTTLFDAEQSHYQLAYGRRARTSEIREAMAYVHQLREEFQSVKTPADQLTRAALASYLRVILGSDEFLYVD